MPSAIMTEHGGIMDVVLVLKQKQWATFWSLNQERDRLSLTWIFENLKFLLTDKLSHETTLPNPSITSKIVPLPYDLIFKYMSLWVLFLVKPHGYRRGKTLGKLMGRSPVLTSLPLRPSMCDVLWLAPSVAPEPSASSQLIRQYYCFEFLKLYVTKQERPYHSQIPLL